MDLKDIHAEALSEFSEIQTALFKVREECRKDREFYSVSGEQWADGLGDQFKNKIRFEMNKIHLSIIRIINEYRNNSLGVTFESKDGDDDELADLCMGLYRNDEQSACGQEAYDNCFEEGVGGGFGAFRLRADYEDDENEEEERQRIYFEAIPDADTCVFYNADAKQQDKSDATKCWVLDKMSLAAYKKKWGDDPASWPRSNYGDGFKWYDRQLKIVWVAEYFEVENNTRLMRIFRGLDGSEEKLYQEEFDDDDTLEETLKAKGYTEVRRRKIKSRKVHKYIMNGNKILEDCGYIAGKNIPIIPFYAKRWFIDGVEYSMGHVRLAKDAQRLKNMLTSKLGEIASLTSYKKPIFAPEQIKGLEHYWAKENSQNYPFLVARMIKDADGNPIQSGPLGYLEPPDVPPALGALLQISEQDIQDLLGNQQAGEEMQSNISGRVVELIQQRLDMQSYIYISNFAKSVKRAGEVWLSMAKDILIEKNRKMKTIEADGETQGFAVLMRPIVDENTGEIKYENDISKAFLEVGVTVGPSYTSRRNAVVNSLTGMLQFTQNDPDATTVLTATALMNMEGEGIGDLRKYFRKKLINMGAVEPTDEEKQQLEEEQANAANQPPDAQTQFLQAESQKSIALAQKAQADSILAISKAEESRASTIDTLASLDDNKKAAILKNLQSIQDLLTSGGAASRIPTPDSSQAPISNEVMQ